MNGYPGAKNGSGVYQTIINNMPPHDLYIEAFVGSGAILKRKKPAIDSIVIDADAEIAKRWSAIAKSGEYPNLRAVHGDCRSLIAGFADAKACALQAKSTLIYCDPPYVLSTRRSAMPIYKHEFTDDDHERLLKILVRLKCLVIISGYDCQLYEYWLGRGGWRRVDCVTRSRRGRAIESIWCNFDRPTELHDLRYLGDNFRERERIKRKKARWVARLERMDPLERRVIEEALSDLAASKAAMRAGAKRPTPAETTMRDRAGGGGGMIAGNLALFDVTGTR